MLNKILVTGGAGYIGSHVARKLLDKGYSVLVADNFSTGFVEPMEILRKKYSNFSYMNADLLDTEKLEEMFQNNKIDAVIHLAAKISVPESIEKPDLYNQVNYRGGVNLVEIMTKFGVGKIIFSSTAAVYGDPSYTPIDENHPTKPLNPYGQTKLDFEKYLSRCPNLKYVVFRYFNVGGASLDGILGKSHLESQDLIENIMKVALGQKEGLEIYGDDFKTPDGSAIRDFIHVEDLAEAHILALRNMDNSLPGGSGEVFNLGSEKGFSIKETVLAANKFINKEIPMSITAKRAGDISVSIASSKKAQNLLNWRALNSNLEDIISSDWNWRKDHPMGYSKNNE